MAVSAEDGRIVRRSVHVALFPAVTGDCAGKCGGHREGVGASLLKVRTLVMLELEAMRAAKTIGKSLEAGVTVIATEGSDEAIVLRKYEDVDGGVLQCELRRRCRLSARASRREAVMIEAAGCGWIEVRALLARGAGCWCSDARWPEVCARCAGALEAIGFAPMEGVRGLDGASSKGISVG